MYAHLYFALSTVTARDCGSPGWTPFVHNEDIALFSLGNHNKRGEGRAKTKGSYILKSMGFIQSSDLSSGFGP